MLYVAIFGLSIPLIIRGISNIFSKYLKWYNKIIEGYHNEYFIFMNIVGNIIPICFQLTSLIYGYIRSRQ